MQPIEELERLGIEQDTGSGIFCLDFSAYFPYENQDILELDASLSTHLMESGNVLNIRDLGKLNHRYPNYGYVTLSQKFGRKICRCGSIIQRPHAELTNYKYLNLTYNVKGLNTVRSRMIVPININTSDEKPCAVIEARFMLEDFNRPDLILTIYEKNSVTHSFTYGTDNGSHIAINVGERFTPLTIKEGQLGFIVYQETVSPVPHKLEDVFIW